MASLCCLPPVMPLVLVLSGVVLSVVVRRPLPHCHPPPSLLLLSLLPSLLWSIVIVVIIVIRQLPLLSSVIRHPLPPPSSSSLSHVLFDCCVFFVIVVSSFAVARHRLHHRCHVALHGSPSSSAAQPSNPPVVDCCKRSLHCCLSVVLGLVRGLIWLSQGGVHAMTRNIIFLGGDVALRFAASCEPSPRDNGPTCLPIEVGRRNVRVEGAY
jgi:hypothetical protein